MLHVMICHYTPVYYNMYIIIYIYILCIYTLYTYLWFSIIFPNQFDFLSSRLELSRWPQDHRAHHWTSDPEKGSSNLSHSVTLEVDVHDPYKLWSFTLTTPHNISQHHTTSQNTTQHLKTLHNISKHHITSHNVSQHLRTYGPNIASLQKSSKSSMVKLDVKSCQWVNYDVKIRHTLIIWYHVISYHMIS